MLPAILLAFLILPVLVTFLYTRKVRHTIRRPGLFLAGGIFEGYLVVAGILWWMLEPLTSIGVAGISPGNPANMSPLDGYGRFFVGIAIAALLHLFTLWCTHRGVARA